MHKQIAFQRQVELFLLFTTCCDECFLRGPYFMFDFPAKVLVYRPSMWIFGFLGSHLPLVPRSHKGPKFGMLQKGWDVHEF